MRNVSESCELEVDDNLAVRESQTNRHRREEESTHLFDTSAQHQNHSKCLQDRGDRRIAKAEIVHENDHTTEWRASATQSIPLDLAVSIPPATAATASAIDRAT